jgi:exopolysaccharide biosynthesis polyprenyl glycosylphosphotransferase
VTTQQTRRTAEPQEGSRWRVVYARRLALSDAVVIVVTTFGVQYLWFGTSAGAVDLGEDGPDIAVNYTIVSCVLVLAWMAVLHITSTRDYRVVGTGTQEYRRVADATLRLFGVIAIVAFLVDIDLARGYIVTGLPLGLLLLLTSRALWRAWLSAQRRRGDYSSLILLVGSLESVTVTAERRGDYSSLILLVGSLESVTVTAATLRRAPAAGYRVVGACLTGDDRPARLPDLDVPVLGHADEALSALQSVGADTLVITSSDELPPERIREIGWSLEPGRHHLVMAPGLTDVGGPRIHTRPVAGLPLLHVETPRLESRKLLTKRLFDVVVSALTLIVLSPLLLAIAILIKATSPGPVLYRQERIGRNGQPFAMLKFRSMRPGADAELFALLEERGAGDTPLFKVEDDPRVTRVGAVLRRYSLDELPQFANVLAGSMSLIGPRPQRESEVALYDSVARRRLLIKPGMSGLWQVSGRSTLSWEDAIRLDLYYVENWSLTGDIVILARTFAAVIRAEGAF